MTQLVFYWILAFLTDYSLITSRVTLVESGMYKLESSSSVTTENTIWQGVKNRTINQEKRKIRTLCKKKRELLFFCGCKLSFDILWSKLAGVRGGGGDKTLKVSRKIELLINKNLINLLWPLHCSHSMSPLGKSCIYRCKCNIVCGGH